MKDKAYIAHTRLRQLAECRAQIDLLRNRIDELTAVAEQTGCGTDAERVQASVKPDRLEKAVIQILEERDKLEERCWEWAELNRQILEELEKVKPVSRAVLTAHYLQRESDDITAERLHYSDGYIRQLRLRALEEYTEKNNLIYFK